jgi:lysophospholipase L1-like esterase
MRSWIKPLAEWEADRRQDHRAARMEQFEAENPAAPAGAIVFLGSSTIERWPLSRCFPGKPCVDRGIGDETAELLLQRLDASIPDARPAGFVLYGGSLDFRREDLAPHVTRARVEAVVAELQRRCGAETPIAVLGLLPEREMPAHDLIRLTLTNNELMRMCAVRGVAWVPTWRPPVKALDGTLAAASAADELHLNDAGYDAVARWLIADGGEVGRLLAP